MNISINIEEEATAPYIHQMALYECLLLYWTELTAHVSADFVIKCAAK